MSREMTMRYRVLASLTALALLGGTAGAQARPTGTVIVNNMTDSTVTVVDVASQKAIATLRTGEGPHEVAVSHDGRWAAVSNYGIRGKPGNTISVIDVAKVAVVRTLTLDGYVRPHGMVFLPGDTLIAATSETIASVLIVDVRDGRVLSAYPTKGRTPHMVGMTADGTRLVTGNITEGTISIIDRLDPAAVRSVKVARSPEGVAISPDGRFVWAGSNTDSVVVVVDALRGVPVDTLRNFGFPYRIAISADNRTAVVTDPMKAQVRIFDAGTRKQRFQLDIPRDSVVAGAEVPGSPAPEGVAISRDSRWAFVTLQGRNRVITIDLEKGTIVGTAVTGRWSDGVGYSPIRR